MKLGKALLVVASILTLVGCAASKQPAVYDAKKSFALNVVNAAGMKDIGDHAVPRAEYEKLANNPVYQAGWTASFYNNPAPGFSSGTGLALGLMGMIFSPTGDAEYDVIMAWMPQDLAASPQEAAERLRDIFQEATHKAAQSMQMTVFDTHLHHHRSLGYIATNVLTGDSQNCDQEPVVHSKPQHCYTYIAIKDPVVSEAPHFVSNERNPAYLFRVRSAYNNAIRIAQPDVAKLSARQLMGALSKHLPSWVYLYSAPEGKTRNEKKKSFPVLFSEGKAHLFITPK